MLHLILIVFALVTPARADTPPAPTGPVTVIDGDTVEQGGVRWRLDGIDAPEIQGAHCGYERERGIRGAARLLELIATRGAAITPTVNGKGRIASGGFGRRLGRLTFSDGVAWAEIATAEGHALPWRYGTRRPDWCQPPAS